MNPIGVKNMNHKSVRKLAIAAMFIALEFILIMTPIGMIPIGIVSITLMHIPVIIVALVEGMGTGLVVAASFGGLSLYRALSQPALLGQLFRNPLISILPRLMIPIAVVLVFRMLGRMGAKRVVCAIAAAAGSIANTLFTVGAMSAMIALNPSSVGITQQAVRGYLIAVWASIALNAVLECIVAVVIAGATAPTLLTLGKQNK